MHKCAAQPCFPDAPPCPQEAAPRSPVKFCTYHEKVRLGLIDETPEDERTWSPLR